MATRIILILLLALPVFAAEQVSMRDYVDKRFEAQNKYETLEREYIESKFASQEKLSESKINSIVDAIGQARNAMEFRLDELNQFRDSNRDLQNTLIPRKEVEASLKQISEDIKILREAKATMEGKASQNAMLITLVVAACSLVIGIISLFKKQKP